MLLRGGRLELALRARSAASRWAVAAAFWGSSSRLLDREDLACLLQPREERVVVVRRGGGVLRAGGEVGDGVDVHRVERVARAGALVDLRGTGVRAAHGSCRSRPGPRRCGARSPRCRPGPARAGSAPRSAARTARPIRELARRDLRLERCRLRAACRCMGEPSRDCRRKHAGCDGCNEYDTRDLGPEVHVGTPFGSEVPPSVLAEHGPQSSRMTTWYGWCVLRVVLSASLKLDQHARRYNSAATAVP